MKQLIEFTLNDDDTQPIWVEIDLAKDDAGEMEVTRGDTTKKAAHTFHKALDIVKPVAKTIISKFSNLTERPQEIEVEFGLKLNAEAGAILTTTGLESHFKVTLKWKQETGNKE